MKKSLLLILFGCFITSWAFTQNLVLLEGTKIVSSDTFFIWADTGQSELKADVLVTNVGTNTITAKVKKVIVNVNDTVTGTSNYFCWGACFDASVYVSPFSLDINPGDTLDELTGFAAHYEHHGHIGTTYVTYVFYDVNNTSDSASVVVSYHVGYVGMNDMAARNNIKLSNAYPNPASNYTAFNYSISDNQNARVVINNILGSTVKELNINNAEGKLIVNTDDINNGIYFYSFIVDNKTVATKKLIINH